MKTHIHARGVEVDDTLRCFIESSLRKRLGPWAERTGGIRVSLLNADRKLLVGPVVCSIHLSIDGTDYEANGCCIDAVSAVRRAVSSLRPTTKDGRPAPRTEAEAAAEC